MKPRALAAAQTCICIYVGKKFQAPAVSLASSGRIAAKRRHAVSGSNAFMRVLRPVPRWPGRFELGHSAGGDREPLLAAVFPGPDGHPFGVKKRAEISRQRRFFMHCQIGQVTLSHFAGTAKQLEQRVLRGAKANTSQLLVVEPADGSRRLTEGAAKAHAPIQVVVLASHIRCIYSEPPVVKGPTWAPLFAVRRWCRRRPSGWHR